MSTGYALPINTARPSTGHSRPDSAWTRLMRRVRALVRLAIRYRRARRNYIDLDHLDDRTLRDLGVTRSELSSLVSELTGQVAATRRRTDGEVWLSTSRRFRARAVDSSL